MSIVYRVDIDNKPIVHGRRYVYDTGHPYHPRIAGVILWDRDVLNYIFQPDDKELEPIPVKFEIRTWHPGLKQLEAVDFWREPKKRKVSNGNGLV